MASSLLILGGAQSGKSRYAVALHPPRHRVTFVATAHAHDADMAARIARHRAARPPSWRTIEEPLELAQVLKDAARVSDAVIVDCLTLWVANLMRRGDPDALVLKAGDELAAVVLDGAVDLALVSNEVGQGVHPATADGIRFRDLLGGVNQRVAAVCERVVMMVAGLPLTLKEPPPRSPLADVVQAP